jgi:hypothetical protein
MWRNGADTEDVLLFTLSCYSIVLHTTKFRGVDAVVHCFATVSNYTKIAPNSCGNEIAHRGHKIDVTKPARKRSRVALRKPPIVKVKHDLRARIEGPDHG